MSVPFTTWPWQHWAAERPDAVAIRLSDQSITWATLSSQIEIYAQGLLEQGIKRDQLVAAIAPNGLPLLGLLLATMRVGARFVGLNPRASAPELQAQLAQLDCDAIWYPEGSDPLSAETSAEPVSSMLRLHLQPAEQPRLVPVTWQPSRAVTLTLTSGSTGTPKAVVHSGLTHLASAAGLLAWLPFEQEDSWLLSLPLFHISGMAIVWRWLYRGAEIVVCAPDQMETLLMQVTHASLVPTQLQRVLDSDAVASLDLKQVLLGGAMIPVSLTDAARERGIECWCGYGMTEMASTVTAKRANASAGVGAVLPHREVMLQDGEVWVKGETLCLGYYRNKTVFPVSEQAWFATKDLGHWQDEELHITGRADNMFISGGENVQPEDIERVLLAHPQISQAFVLPIDDAEFGQRPVAIVALSPDSTPYREQLVAYMQTQVAAYRRPVAYYLLPQDVAGGIKVSRAQLAQWLAQDRLVTLA